MTQKYKSIFVPGLEIDLDNYIAELIIDNKLTRCKLNRPKCAFWRKEISAAHPEFKDLSKDYILELSFIKRLRASYSGATIIAYIKERGIITFRYLDKDKQRTVCYNLMNNEFEYQKKIKAQRKKTNSATKTKKVQKRKSKESDMTGLL